MEPRRSTRLSDLKRPRSDAGDDAAAAEKKAKTKIKAKGFAFRAIKPVRASVQDSGCEDAARVGVTADLRPLFVDAAPAPLHAAATAAVVGVVGGSGSTAAAAAAGSSAAMVVRGGVAVGAARPLALPPTVDAILRQADVSQEAKIEAVLEEIVTVYMREVTEASSSSAGVSATAAEAATAIGTDFIAEVRSYMQRRAESVAAAEVQLRLTRASVAQPSDMLALAAASVDEAAIAAALEAQFPACHGLVDTTTTAIDDLLFKADDAVESLRCMRNVVEDAVVLNDDAQRAARAHAFRSMAHIEEPRLLVKGTLNPHVVAAHDALVAASAAAAAPVAGPATASRATTARTPAAAPRTVTRTPTRGTPSRTAATPTKTPKTPEAAAEEEDDTMSAADASARSAGRSRNKRASVLNSRAPRVKEVPPAPRTPLGALPVNGSPTPVVVKKILRGSSVRRNAPSSVVR